jgi:hypothetical protein
MELQRKILWLFGLGFGMLFAGVIGAEELQIPSDSVPAAPEQYIVKKGDTLWGISNDILKDPFLWPKVWRENPGVENPDLIYPGKLIHLPGAEAAPQQESAPLPTPPPSEPIQSSEAGPPPPLAPVEPEATPALPEVSADEEVDHRAHDPFQVLAAGAILPEVMDRGVVIGGVDAREMLALGDTVYLRSKKEQLEPGQDWVLFRVSRKVYHPVTGQYLGELINILGQAKVVRIEEGFAVSRITRSVDGIHRGDRIAPLNLFPEGAVGNPPDGLGGFVVDLHDEKVGSAILDIVYIDRGKKDGVGPGDRFSIIKLGRRVGFYNSTGDRLPPRQVGELEILSSQEETSTAQIIRSAEPILRGDRLVLNHRGP